MKISTNTETQYVKVPVNKNTIVIEVDQDFLGLVNGIGAVSTNDLQGIGMTEDQAIACSSFYNKVTDELEKPEWDNLVEIIDGSPQLKSSN